MRTIHVMDTRPLGDAIYSASMGKFSILPSPSLHTDECEEVWRVAIEFALSTSVPLKKCKGIGEDSKLSRLLKKAVHYFPAAPPKYGYKWQVREGVEKIKIYSFLKELLCGRKLVVPILTRYHRFAYSSRHKFSGTYFGCLLI